MTEKNTAHLSEASSVSSRQEQHVESLQEQQKAASRRASAVLTEYEHLSYGAGGLKGLVQSPYVFAAAFVASMGGFSFGYGELDLP